MTQIDKVQFKFTIPNIIAIVASTITLMTTIYAYKAENNGKLAKLSSRMQSIETNQDISRIEQQNGFKLINNVRKRDSADAANSSQDIKEQLRELRGIVLHTHYGRDLADN